MSDRIFPAKYDTHWQGDYGLRVPIENHSHPTHVMWEMTSDVAREIAQMIEDTFSATDAAQQDGLQLRMVADLLDPPEDT